MFTVLLRACLFYAVAAQNLTVPSDIWRKPSANISREMIEKCAYKAAMPISRQELLVKQPGLTYLNDVTSAYAALTLNDYYGNNSSWAHIGTDTLQNYIRENGFFDATSENKYSDVNYWGLALFYAYCAYREESLLDSAIDAWNITYSNAFITPPEAASGSGAGRNISLFPPVNCSTDGTFAGGVFFRQAQNDALINSPSTSSFLALSAYLFEETKDTMYQEAAQLSLDFIVNHLWNGTIVYDSIFLNSCERPVYGNLIWSANQAWVIEGLSVLANFTRNVTQTMFLETIVLSTAMFSGWSYPDGILNDEAHDPSLTGPDQTLKGLLIRGLTEARIRNPGTDLAQFIEAYVSVQFNAIQDNAQATVGNDTFYSRTWNGPPPTSFDIGGNIAALDALNAAISLAAPSAEASPSSNPPHTHTPAGVIVGSVVGGVMAAISMAAGVIMCRRRKRMEPVETIQMSAPSATETVEPFIMRATPRSTASSKWGRPNESPQNSGASLPTVSIPDSNRGQDPRQEPVEGADLPSLVQRLYVLLQRTVEAPPQYTR